jgi:hypothetical protein
MADENTPAQAKRKKPAEMTGQQFPLYLLTHA